MRRQSCHLRRACLGAALLAVLGTAVAGQDVDEKIDLCIGHEACETTPGEPHDVLLLQSRVKLEAEELVASAERTLSTAAKGEVHLPLDFTHGVPWSPTQTLLKFSSAFHEGGEGIPSYEAEKAIDDYRLTRQAYVGGAWEGDLGSVLEIFTIEIVWEACRCDASEAMHLQVSTDRQTWTLFDWIGGFHRWGGRQAQSYGAIGPVFARYVRISPTEWYNTDSVLGNLFSMWDIRVQEVPYKVVRFIDAWHRDPKQSSECEGSTCGPKNAIDNLDTTKSGCFACVWGGDLGSEEEIRNIQVTWETCDCSQTSSFAMAFSKDWVHTHWFAWTRIGGETISGRELRIYGRTDTTTTTTTQQCTSAKGCSRGSLAATGRGSRRGGKGPVPSPVPPAPSPIPPAPAPATPAPAPVPPAPAPIPPTPAPATPAPAPVPPAPAPAALSASAPAPTDTFPPARFVWLQPVPRTAPGWFSMWDVKAEVRVSLSGPKPWLPQVSLPECPVVQQATIDVFQPPGEPNQTDCAYDDGIGKETLSEILETICGNPCQVAAHTVQAIERTRKRHPAQIAEEVMKNLAKVGGLYFTQPELERDLDFTASVLELTGAGLSALVGGRKLKTFMMEEGITDSKGLRNQVKDWIKTRNAKKLKKVAVSGALDVIGNIAGPLGIAGAVADAVLAGWQTASDQQIMAELANQIIAEVTRMVDGKLYSQLLSKVRGYLSSFVDEFVYMLGLVAKVAEQRPEHGGMMQLILLNSLQSDLATTRYEWMPFSDEEACEHASSSCTSACGKVRNSLPHIWPMLISMHLSLMQQMMTAVAHYTAIAHEVKKKLYQHAYEYYVYMDRWKPEFIPHDFWNGDDDVSTYRRPTIPAEKIRVCFSQNAADWELWASGVAGWGNWANGLKKALLDLTMQGHEQGFLNLSTSSLVNSSTSVLPFPWSSLQRGAEVRFAWASKGKGKGEGRARPRLVATHEHNVAIEMLKLRSHALSAMTGRAFAHPPKLRAPRSHWEAEFHEICGPGLSCFRGDPTKEKAAAFKQLAHKVAKTIQGE